MAQHVPWLQLSVWHDTPSIIVYEPVERPDILQCLVKPSIVFYSKAPLVAIKPNDRVSTSSEQPRLSWVEFAIQNSCTPTKAQLMIRYCAQNYLKNFEVQQ